MAQFQKGVSGNPKGRKPGVTPGAKVRQAIEKRADDILQSVINAAIGGDIQACKILLDRITPPLKPTAQPVQIPVGSTLPESGANVVTATLAGDIPPDIGSALIRALTEQGKLIELEEMSERLQRLEKLLDSRT
ncbi:MAG: DUF5681 domain-containing protein [Methylobacter sp.]